MHSAVEPLTEVHPRAVAALASPRSTIDGDGLHTTALPTTALPTTALPTTALPTTAPPVPAAPSYGVHCSRWPSSSAVSSAVPPASAPVPNVSPAALGASQATFSSPRRCTPNQYRDSSTRVEVVPTGTIGRPSSRLCAIAASSCTRIEKRSACIWCSARRGAAMGLKVPAPTCSESLELATPAALRRSRSALVKWSPAVGAATLPSCAAEA